MTLVGADGRHVTPPDVAARARRTETRIPRIRPYGRGRIAAAVRAADDRDMFSGAHVILYTRDAEADRAFLKDVAGFPHVDAGRGWLVFALPPAEVAVHPTTEEPKHELYLMCDDLAATLKDLEDRGAEISRAITDQGWGLLAAVRLPSGTELPLYEPRHPTAHSLSL